MRIAFPWIRKRTWFIFRWKVSMENRCCALWSGPAVSEDWAMLQKRTGSLQAALFHEKICGSDLGIQRFLHLRELQLGFGEGLDDQTFRVFSGQVASGGHFADQ